MKPTALFSRLAALLAAPLLQSSSSSPILAAAASSDTARIASIYAQPVSPNAPPPSLLAEVEYNPFVTPGAPDAGAPATVRKYEAPSLSSADHQHQQLFRVGVYDPSAGRWLSSTSTASAANLVLNNDDARDASYAPTVVLTVDPAGGQVVGAAVRGVRSGAADKGAQAVLRVTDQARGPELNKPVVLSADGKKVPPPEEKSMLQKYWWVIAIVIVLSVTGGGGEEGK